MEITWAIVEYWVFVFSKPSTRWFCCWSSTIHTHHPILKSLRHLKNEKPAGRSRVVTEMLKAVPNICSEIIVDLMNAIMFKGKAPADWIDNTVSLYEEKGDVLDQNNYCGLKLTGHTLKVNERVAENINDTVIIDEMQCGFYPVEVQQMQFLFLNSFKGTILQNTRNCTWHLLIWKRP